MHATEFLQSHSLAPEIGILVLFGTERHLKLQILSRLPGFSDDDEGPSVTRVKGSDADWRTVHDDLITISMFSDSRTVLIEDADDFVSNHRAVLETYFEKPAKSSLLILDVKSWPKNTRLAKRTGTTGMALDCGELKAAELIRWLQHSAESNHHCSLDKSAAQLMVELAGTGLGILEQELAKLSGFAGPGGHITMEAVTRLVGGWAVQTTWEMLAAVRHGHVSKAIELLDKLLDSGEAAQRVLGGIGFSYRRLAQATELARTGTPVRDALRAAGVFHGEIEESEKYLRRIGFAEAEQFLPRLIRTDTALKGGSRADPRLIMTHLLAELTGPI